MDMQARHIEMTIHCRIGSLENPDVRCNERANIHCRIGSLEMRAASAIALSGYSLPHRQLRKTRESMGHD